VQPRKFTDVLFVDVPRTRNYLVFGKTEVQNNGQSSQFTCEMAAYDLTSGRIAASDAVSVFVPQGQFTGFAFTFVAPGDFSLGPFATFCRRLFIHCGAMGADSSNFVMRQSKITALRTDDVEIKGR
jgi:hypothetical protein